MSENSDSVKRLMKAGADVNIARNDGSTALILSSFHNEDELVEAQLALLEA